MRADLTASETVVGELERRLARLAYEARTGAPDAEAELAEVEAQLIAHERAERLEALAREEDQRRREEQEERERQAQHDRDQRASDKAETVRDQRLKELQLELVTLASRVRSLVEAEADASEKARFAGRSFHSKTQTAAELIAITCRDAGITEEPIGYVRNSVRSSILAAYPMETTGTTETTTTTTRSVAACTVCAHPEREDLEAALATGTSYRETAETFGVSRSAIGRHAQHS
jgi:hypothetical protein